MTSPIRPDWKITKTTRHDVHNVTWRLEAPSGRDVPYACEVFLARGAHRDTAPSVRAKFEAPSIPYARAEAARMYAVLCDTTGDLAFCGDEPLDIEAPVLDLSPRCPTISVAGWDALTAVAAFFSDALFEVL